MRRFRRCLLKVLRLSTNPVPSSSFGLQAEENGKDECPMSNTCVNRSVSDRGKAELQIDSAKVKEQKSASLSISQPEEKVDVTAHSLEADTTSSHNVPSVALTEDVVSEIPQFDSSDFQPNLNDLRYSIVSEHPLSDNTRFVVAPISSNGDVNSSAAIPSTSLGDVLADDRKLDGTFRRIHVRFDGDPEGSRARVQLIMHDTGSGVSLAFESKMRALGLNFEPVTYNINLISITGEVFCPIGRKHLCFSYYDFPDKDYWTDIIVLSDPVDDLKPGFDILFGRDTIRKVGAITYDLGVIGVNYVRVAA